MNQLPQAQSWEVGVCDHVWEAAHFYLPAKLFPTRIRISEWKL